MIQPGEIQSIAGKEGVRDTQIEKDYVISWATYGIANIPFLKKNLIFKGGTVLKKAYFPDYRFSEDLDFTFSPADHGSSKIGVKDFDIEVIKTAFKELIEWVYAESRISLSIKMKYNTIPGITISIWPIPGHLVEQEPIKTSRLTSVGMSWFITHQKKNRLLTPIQTFKKNIPFFATHSGK